MDSRGSQPGLSERELARVLSRYDLGEVHSAVPFRRGSPESPKALLATSKGRYVLKRRAPGQDQPRRVAFTHSLQLHMAAGGFPVPMLLGTRSENNSMLQLAGRVYEISLYMEGSAWDASAEAAHHAGHAMAVFHAMAASFQSPWPMHAGSYHADPHVAGDLERIVSSSPNAQDRTHARGLAAAYTRAAAAASGAGALPHGPTHSDWHPGNLLFRERCVAAVFDLDSVRGAPLLTDVAAGALWFSLRGSGDPASWPAQLDTERWNGFLSGYVSGGGVIATHELSLICPLMIESLIAETARRVARTGRFGAHEPASALLMAQRTAAWIDGAADRLAQGGWLHSSAHPSPPTPPTGDQT